jgi:cytochrome P450
MPRPAVAPFALPWDDPHAPEPVAALVAARAALGDTFLVESGPAEYLFVFGEADLRAFYALAERDASKGLADYRMLVRKLPLELFAERRTFPHDLFGKQEVETYLDNLDFAVGEQLGEMGDAGAFDVFDFARRAGHRIALACWLGREAPVDALIPDMDVLDGAEAFVSPERMAGSTHDEERAALARVEKIVTELVAMPGRAPSFLDEIAARWSDAPEPDAGIAGDVVIMHVATMTNLFAALGWTLAQVLLHPTTEPLEICVLESIRLGQRSIMLREVLRRIEFAGYALEPGVQIATMLPVTNVHVGVAYEPGRWHDRALQQDVAVTTFGRGGHRCPAQRFSISAIVRTVARLQATFDLRPRFDRVEPRPLQIGGVGRASAPCPVDYRRLDYPGLHVDSGRTRSS